MSRGASDRRGWNSYEDSEPAASSLTGSSRYDVKVSLVLTRSKLLQVQNGLATDPSQNRRRGHSKHSGDESIEDLESGIYDYDDNRESDDEDVRGYGKRENREDRVIEWPPKGFRREDSLSHLEAEELISWGTPMFRGMEQSSYLTHGCTRDKMRVLNAPMFSLGTWVWT
jgi:hypothetical protein